MLYWSASARIAGRPSVIADLTSLPGTFLADYLQLSTLNQRKVENGSFVVCCGVEV
jgi:hypothetical protein